MNNSHFACWKNSRTIHAVNNKQCPICELDVLNKRIQELEKLLKRAQSINESGCGWLLHGNFYNEIEATLKGGKE